ncbi:MAG: hypothetical protein C4540_02125 [Candidatus Omnitrophota bacterium]|jgi:type IV pilus assembly protein PilB|nr:MAG: hypothetical protein C4540_02125 [Candidatus Omnitrophota bacterium]
MSPVRRTKTKIGEILVQKGVITHEQLQEALAFQHSQGQGKRLGQILVELGHLDRDELCLALAVQCGYPYIAIEQCLIEPDVLSAVPEELVRKYQILPIDKIGDVLTIAMVNPLERAVIKELQQVTGSHVIAYLTTPVELKGLISKYYAKR